MKRQGKDSPEVVRFMSLFAKLKDWIDDDPSSIATLAKDDEVLRKLCSDVYWAGHFAQANDRRYPEIFAVGVDPIFIQTWRDFEDRYQSVLATVWLSDFFAQSDLETSPALSRADQSWEFAQDEAAETIEKINKAIDFCRSNADQDHHWDEDQKVVIGHVREGISALEGLRLNIGLDLVGVFRRRNLIPFVLIPRDIAKRSSISERASLLAKLRQAHDAFVFGAPFAALALMRAIMEEVLKDHYKAKGNNLQNKINSARHLPPGVTAAGLDRLREIVNAILHIADQAKASEDRLAAIRLQKLDGPKLEKEMVSLLLLLRALIEGVR